MHRSGSGTLLSKIFEAKNCATLVFEDVFNITFWRFAALPRSFKRVETGAKCVRDLPDSFQSGSEGLSSKTFGIEKSCGSNC